MMKSSEIRKLTEKQINDKIADLKEELFNLKFQAALGNVEKPTRMNEIKRTIARMKTILTEGTFAKEEAPAKKKPGRKPKAAKAEEATAEEASKAE